ncbi:MAG TPA: YebC/PmpR family DNA-binding transcriptional regulator [Chitinophagaceae bacterium]|nr:YebC/PmpR family DNA-binding transcriptional regulator [Chitinophagaceae bacterium]MCC6635911.1 YebC/PmpR family DNA-binding transcriptional regulator [Chitinophagaceae bacterium]HNF29820.1 YebC/PmpR family DNA-binding transcriptional regulator [Chitinophagaceae bacterium]HNM34956.1 YebC/PmpR family DNA-binding transcriptional regulator [Chitinophagaceae bacterium]HNN31489.1 YebC/PmpR family DNA-binding transcriptional regulator [Chitinophagaceae bacterium]
MGRIFEVRKATMFARWDRMAKQFTRIGKEIAIAVKAGGTDPHTNPALRRCMQNAKSVNMPKDRVEAAIKRAMGKEMENYEEILYEGYAPHGVAILVETATDNHVRTVANVKSHFNKGGGSLGNSGSVSFQFKKMGVFKLKADGLNVDDLELELIDYGLEEIGDSTDDDGNTILVMRCEFTDFGNLQKILEEKNITPITAELEWIPSSTVPVNDAQAEDISKLIERLEQDDDVNKVFHNMG